MEVTSAIFTDKDGNQRTSMIARDISRRKQVERDLQENQTRLQLFIGKNSGAFMDDRHKPALHFPGRCSPSFHRIAARTGHWKTGRNRRGFRQK